MLIGHSAIFNRLKKKIDNENFAHAQLFIGPKHVGKTKTALNLAVYMQGGEENVIVKKHILEGVHSDTLLFLDNGENLTIEEVRSIVARATQTHTSPYLIVVIEDLARMRVEAVNTLLKTLEEPGEGVQFFLTANDEESVLPTIASRCASTYFQTVPDSEMQSACSGHVQAENLLMFAMGRPGKLKRLMEDNEYFLAHQNMLMDISTFLGMPSIEGGFALARKYEGSVFLAEFLDVLLQKIRFFTIRNEAPQSIRHLDFPAILEHIETAESSIKENVNLKLTLEDLFLSFVP